MNIRKSLLCLCLLAGSLFALPCFSQCFSGSYTAEWQWNTNKKTNWLNLLRLDLNLPIKSGTDYLEAATLHMAKAKEGIGTDWQAFSNIEADNNVAALAVLGYRHAWENANVFLGVRNVNEDFFTSDATSLFVNSSCGIFPTIAASYPIANYPFSGLTVYFDVSRNGWTFRNSLYWCGLQRVAPSRQSLSRASERRRRFQHLAIGIFPPRRALLRRRSRPQSAVCR